MNTSSLPRSSGVLLPLSSLPGGRLGDEAYRFADWLAQAGQTWWQLLPLGPPDRYGSPYKSSSAFAAWRGFLADPDAQVTAEERKEFRRVQAPWIEDWIRFGGRGALDDQIRFDREWAALRAYCAERAIRLLGDVAIYVAPRSADHRAHPELFQRGAVAGAPPDAFSESGQLWANPLYDWPALRRRQYRWWVQRMRRALALYDVVRIDHFRGFVAYWSVPEEADEASAGRWRRGPGHALFDRIAAALGGELPFVAEDLGVITPAVERLRDSLGLPGMLVLQFGFDPEDPDGPHRFENHVENRFVYTGTHDHDSARGWYESLSGPLRAGVDAEFAKRGVAEREPWWSLISLTLRSPARVAVMQAQDILGLGSAARMNDPARPRGNWRWQLEPGALTPALARRLAALTEETARRPA